MKILLSAYACEPNLGSEPGVGWHWALELARLGHEVWVLTRESNRSSVESVSNDCEELGRLNFLYYDLPAWAKWWKRGGRGIRLYYFLWQVGAYKVARYAHRKVKFDRVHHVTFVSVRQPSFMGNLGIPFLFGPVGGGERAPFHLRAGYGFRGWLLDGLRDLANYAVKLDPFMWHTFSKATVIYVTSEQTRTLIPKRFIGKTRIQLAIGWECNGINSDEEGRKDEEKIFRILYVGNFLYLKGMHLGLAAFAGLVKSVPDARLTLVGRGPDEHRWRHIADELDIADRVDWLPWVSQNELECIYRRHDVFLFPSLHDSGGMVVLEAMAHGLPVVCLNLGGPGVIVNESCGRKIDVLNKAKKDVVKSLVSALVGIAKNRNIKKELSVGAHERCRDYEWGNVVRKLYL